MHVAVIVRNLRIGGMQSAAVNLANAFAEYGHESHLIYFKERGKVLDPNKNVHLHHFNLDHLVRISIIGFFWDLLAKLLNGLMRGSYFLWRGPIVTVMFKWKLRQLEKKYGKLDLIIIRAQGAFDMVWPLYDKRVVQQQVSVSFGAGSKLRKFYSYFLYHHKNMLCNSTGVEEEFLQSLQNTFIKPKRVDVITNLLNLEEIRQRSLAYQPDIDTDYIINVSRFVSGKRVPFLLDAYAYARSDLGLKHKLVLIGDGDQQKEIEEKIQALGLQEHVVLTGRIPNPQPWIKHADLFVFTSAAEGLPNVLLEALACGTNVVSTLGRGGIKDVMKGELSSHLTGYDKVELAEKIVSELNTTTPVDFDRALQDFQPKNIIDRYVELYT